LRVALEELAARIAKSERAGLADQLAVLDAKIAHTLDLAVDLGDLEAGRTKLRTLRTERALPTLELFTPVLDPRGERDDGIGRQAKAQEISSRRGGRRVGDQPLRRRLQLHDHLRRRRSQVDE
jgi:hypothetical protein